MNTDHRIDQSPVSTAGLSRRAALGRAAGVGVVAALLTAAGSSGALAQGTPTPRRDEVNAFRLGDAETEIAYATTSERGLPVLTYDGPFGSHTFEGDEVRTEESALGRLVTVDLGGFPDRGRLWLTLLLPAFNPVNAQDPPSPFTTLAILKWEISTIAGPPREGVLEEYDVVELEGTAELLYF